MAVSGNKLAIVLGCIQIMLMAVFAAKEIFDPMNIFCGSHNCYDVLTIKRNATHKQIRRAYRRLSLEYHPDKSVHKNATEVFRLISKAYEVLDGNETRANFDYYLDHPRDYFKVSGRHFARNVPKSNPIFVVIAVVGLFSWLMYNVQMQRHEKAKKFLKDAVLECATKGGKSSSKQTVELFNRAAEKYNTYMKNGETTNNNNNAVATALLPNAMLSDVM
jgi:curved DNA-binding protein CbpA